MFRIFKIMNRNFLNPNKSNNILPLSFGIGIGNNNNSVDNVRFYTIQSNPADDETSQKNQPKSLIEENPYYSKYADKIKKAQKLNKTNQQVFNENKNEKTITEIDETKTTQQQIGNENEDLKLKSEINSIKESVKKSDRIGASLSKKKLEDIVKMELFEDKSKDEITEIWNAYHSKRDCIYAVIPSSLYEEFFKNLREYPTFILPLPRTTDSKPSYEFFLMQSQDHCCYFTPLAAYHLHKEVAPLCLTLYYYPELIQTKKIVLMMGEFDSNIINIVECQCLANQLQYYYNTKEPAPRLSLHMFNKDPKNFDHMRLIQHLEQGFCSPPINLNIQD